MQLWAFQDTQICFRSFPQTDKQGGPVYMCLYFLKISNKDSLGYMCLVHLNLTVDLFSH